MGVHCASLLEYVLTAKGRTYSYFWWGLLVAFFGILVRALAIRTCGNSFSHYIETGDRTDADDTTLVTTGIYAWCRHPSYSGFLLYVVGMQMVLGNIWMAVFCVAVLARFFIGRIRVEEWFLLRRYPEYAEYKASVCALVPFLF